MMLSFKESIKVPLLNKTKSVENHQIKQGSKNPRGSDTQQMIQTPSSCSPCTFPVPSALHIVPLSLVDRSLISALLLSSPNQPRSDKIELDDVQNRQCR